MSSQSLWQRPSLKNSRCRSGAQESSEMTLRVLAVAVTTVLIRNIEFQVNRNPERIIGYHVQRDLGRADRRRDVGRGIGGYNLPAARRRITHDQRTGECSDLLRIKREHWAIENKPHWMLDMAFSEDDC